ISIDQMNPIRPGCNIEAARFTKVEQHRTSTVQQREYAPGTVCGTDVEVGHAPSEQRMSLSEVVVNIEAGNHRGNPPAWFVHAEQFGDGVAKGLVAVVGIAERNLRHCIVQHPGTDRMT